MQWPRNSPCSLPIGVHVHVAYLIGSFFMMCVSLCSGISCMAQDCSLQMPEDFVLPLLPAEELKDKYRRYLFRDYVEVCVCVCVGSVCPAGMCRYSHWDSRGMWEGCEKAQSDLMCLFQWANLWISFTLHSPPPIFPFNIHGTLQEPMAITVLSYTILVKIHHFIPLWIIKEACCLLLSLYCSLGAWLYSGVL